MKKRLRKGYCGSILHVPHPLACFERFGQKRVHRSNGEDVDVTIILIIISSSRNRILIIDVGVPVLEHQKIISE